MREFLRSGLSLCLRSLAPCWVVGGGGLVGDSTQMPQILRTTNPSSTSIHLPTRRPGQTQHSTNLISI